VTGVISAEAGIRSDFKVEIEMGRNGAHGDGTMISGKPE
jgi:hypothetical protein